MSTENTDLAQEEATTIVAAKRPSRLALVAVLFSLLAVIAVSYLFYNMRIRFQIVSNELQQQQTTQQQQETELQQQQQALSNAEAGIAKVEALAGFKDQAWVLAETAYKIQMAMVNLKYARNVPTATALLQSAEVSVANLSDSNLADVRTVLTDTITKLQTVQPVDVDGAASTIAAVQNRIAELPLHIVSTKSEDTGEQDITKEQATTGWRHALQSSMNALKNVVVVRRHDKSMNTVLEVQDQQRVRQIAQLILERAEWGLLQADQAVYQRSIQQAQETIQRYFNTDSHATQQVLANLNDLAKLNVAPTLPDISPALLVVQQAQQQLTSQRKQQGA